MEDFIHPSGIIAFQEIRGEVVGSERSSETHISSRGGTSLVGGNGNVITTPPTISSSTVTTHDFWVKTEDGTEHNVRLINRDIPLRSGQDVSLISASHKGGKTGFYTVLVNHSAGKHWFINDANSLKTKLGFESPILSFIVSVFFAVVAFAIVTNITANFYAITSTAPASYGLIVGGLVLLVRIILVSARSRNLTQLLQKHLENLAQKAYRAH